MFRWGEAGSGACQRLLAYGRVPSRGLQRNRVKLIDCLTPVVQEGRGSDFVIPSRPFRAWRETCRPRSWLRQMPVPKRFASEVLTAVFSVGSDVATSLASPSPLGQQNPDQDLMSRWWLPEPRSVPGPRMSTSCRRRRL